MMGFDTISYYIVNGTPKNEQTKHHDSHRSDYFCTFFPPDGQGSNMDCHGFLVRLDPGPGSGMCD